MTYRRRHYSASDDAHAALVVLEAFGHRAGIVETKVLTPDDGEAIEYEVWCWCGAPARVTAETSAVAPSYDVDEHDRGRSTIWDELDEARRDRRDRYGD